MIIHFTERDFRKAAEWSLYRARTPRLLESYERFFRDGNISLESLLRRVASILGAVPEWIWEEWSVERNTLFGTFTFKVLQSPSPPKRKALGRPPAEPEEVKILTRNFFNHYKGCGMVSNRAKANDQASAQSRTVSALRRMGIPSSVSNVERIVYSEVLDMRPISQSVLEPIRI